MRILQMIDSLEVGGAERMAVNYANALAKVCDFSGLVATRKEGNLKSQLSENAEYLYLNKKAKIDIAAIFRLKAYCTKNDIDLIHAHGSSFFTAFLLKLVYPKIKLVWHDHYGLSEFLSTRPKRVLQIAIPFFNGVIAVNSRLKEWALSALHCKNAIYLPNFTDYSESVPATTSLHGEHGKRILCLANLRAQKNHFMLLDVAERIYNTFPDWSFHFVGKDFNDAYSREIKALILSKKLEKAVFLYGTKDDTNHIIAQSVIAVLSSDSEGLPVALLEYGLYKRPVVVTNVGEIPLIVKNNVNGIMVNAGDDGAFYDALKTLISDTALRTKFGDALYQTVIENHSEHAVISQYLNWLEQL